jgi:integration host factor subunit alpha
MKKSHLIDIIAQKTGYDKIEVEDIVDNMINEIVKTLQEGEGVNLIRFGSFHPKMVKTREIYIPGTNIKVKNKYNRKVVFIPSKVLKEKVNKEEE